MLILTIIFLFHFLLGQLIETCRLKVVAIILSVILLFTVYYFTLGIYYTADYNMYYYTFKYDTETDYLYNTLSVLFKNNNLDFHDLYVFHIVISVLLYYFVISRFTTNIFYVFLAYIIIDYVHYVNQIRYYLGFPIMLVAFYNLYGKNYIRFLFFAFLAFLSHSALIVLLIFVPVYYFIDVKSYVKKMLLFSIICFIIVYLGFYLNFAASINHFGDYFDAGAISSFVGGFFNGIPYIIFMCFLIYESQYYKKRNPDYEDDKQFIFLYKLTFFSIIFIPASFFIQIAGHRYVLPFMVIWVVYFLYILKNYTPNVKIRKMFVFCIVCITANLFIYIIPDFVMKENHFKDELILTLKSIKYLNFNEW